MTGMQKQMSDSIRRGFQADGLVGLLESEGKLWDADGNVVRCAGCDAVIEVLPGERILARPIVDPVTTEVRNVHFHGRCTPSLGI